MLSVVEVDAFAVEEVLLKVAHVEVRVEAGSQVGHSKAMPYIVVELTFVVKRAVLASDDLLLTLLPNRLD